MAKAIFTGSFNPYTIGHHSIVKRALPLFDEVIIAVGVNINKHNEDSVKERVHKIEAVYEKEPKVRVVSYSCLTTEIARQMQANYIIKGVRNVADFEYERTQADINRKLTGVETVMFFALPGMDSVSSSVVRELLKYGADVTDFLP